MVINKANLVFNAPFIKRAKTNRIILHHSGVTVLQSVQVIHDFYLHRVDPNGDTYIGIGYNYYIRKDGSIWEGRPEWARGGHAGLANEDSIGICCEGNFMVEQMGTVQCNSLFWLVGDITARNGKLKVQGHFEVMPTDCPGTNFPLTAIKNMVANPVPVAVPAPVATPSIIPVGSKVKVNTTAQQYATGENIASFVKGTVYTVIQSESNKVLLDGIMSWVKVSDVTVVGTIPQPIPQPAPVVTSIQVGNKVKMTGSKYTTGQSIPLWAKLRTYDVLQVNSDRILIGIGKAITGWIYINEAKKV